MTESDVPARLSRRGFLAGTAAAVGAIGVAGCSTVGPTQSGLAAGGDSWLGTDFWGNRLQDWSLRDGRIVCVALSDKRKLCTVAALTRSLDGRAATLTVTTGTQTGGEGYSGFLVGLGEPGADPRKAALVGVASGAGGGLMAVLDNVGRCRFREHTDEVKQTTYAELPSQQSGPMPPRSTSERISLSLEISPGASGLVSLVLTARDVGGALLSQAVLSNVAAARVIGGVGLLSAGTGSTAATYWFSGLGASGVGARLDTTRRLGPIVGTLFTVSSGVLKLTAQLAPLNAGSDRVRLETSPDNVNWTERATAVVGNGYAAALRVNGWDSTKQTNYRVRFRGFTFGGAVPKEPTSGKLTIAAISCSKATHRFVDRPSPVDPGLPGAQPLGLYTTANVYFPYENVVPAVRAAAPDLLVALGDQFYENSPTAEDQSAAPELDFLYRYLQWLWAWRDVTRNVPTVVLVDDHDIFQGSFWGEGGAALPPGADPSVGGYDNDPAWINLVQRVQCGHNPDPYSTAPMLQGITVYYTTFRYGGVVFAVVQDRAFKTSPDGAPGLPVPQYDLLGARQEAMLADLADQPDPVVVLTQTMYACVETDRNGAVMGVKDSNGWPKPARDRALDLIKDAGALIVSGDTHLPVLVRHGVHSAVDGPLQFGVPAVASSYQRWFDPAGPGGGPMALPTDARDRLGNAFRVLAVANPDVSLDESLRNTGDRLIGDRGVKHEGYGVVKVDKGRRTFTCQAWRCRPGRAQVQLPGWPYVLSFDDA